MVLRARPVEKTSETEGRLGQRSEEGCLRVRTGDMRLTHTFARNEFTDTAATVTRRQDRTQEETVSAEETRSSTKRALGLGCTRGKPSGAVALPAVR